MDVSVTSVNVPLVHELRVVEQEPETGVGGGGVTVPPPLPVYEYSSLTSAAERARLYMRTSSMEPVRY